MSDQFVAEIRIFPFNFAPRGWALCDGQLVSISQNAALFSLLGTTYGGNGTSNFALPNLQGNAPMHPGQSNSGTLYVLGQTGGTTTVTLLQAQMAQHNHGVLGNIGQSELATPSPARSLARANPGQAYTATLTNISQFSATSSILPAGGNQAHNNMMPFLTLNFCIALQGIFPPRS
ncbi:phage tail protein [Bradyrhizobium sp. Pear76]|uniref:phage tail protein n=1 Tax=Bradyrhizobium oropedii TaxID=1571201 RepID=UPI001E378E09|nr:tail fiber protein [Bradyrhizobium oropedii]MCC8968303.1 phage tail protein [Bradyrhizobium oropedii]